MSKQQKTTEIQSRGIIFSTGSQDWLKPRIFFKQAEKPYPREKGISSEIAYQNKIMEAKAILGRVCQADRGNISSWINLVKINTQLGDPTATVKCCRAIVSQRPDIHEAYFQLGQALLLQSEYEAAAECFRHVLVLRFKPNNHLALFQLGKAFHKQTRFDDALTYYRRALALVPNFAEAYDSVGSVLQYQGDMEGAEQNYRMAVQPRPNFDNAHSDLVFAMNCNPRQSAAAIFHEHVRWGRTHKLPPITSPNYLGDFDPARRLRVGYVSPDFCKHSVAFFFEPLIANHDRDKTARARICSSPARAIRFRMSQALLNPHEEGTETNQLWDIFTSSGKPARVFTAHSA